MNFLLLLVTVSCSSNNHVEVAPNPQLVGLVLATRDDATSATTYETASCSNNDDLHRAHTFNVNNWLDSSGSHLSDAVSADCAVSDHSTITDASRAQPSHSGPARTPALPYQMSISSSNDYAPDSCIRCNRPRAFLWSMGFYVACGLSIFGFILLAKANL